MSKLSHKDSHRRWDPDQVRSRKVGLIRIDHWGQVNVTRMKYSGLRHIEDWVTRISQYRS